MSQFQAAETNARIRAPSCAPFAASTRALPYCRCFLQHQQAQRALLRFISATFTAHPHVLLLMYMCPTSCHSAAHRTIGSIMYAIVFMAPAPRYHVHLTVHAAATSPIDSITPTVGPTMLVQFPLISAFAPGTVLFQRVKALCTYQ